MQALKEFTLMGSRYQSGSAIPVAAWERCDVRLRTVLTRNRFVIDRLRPTPAPAPRKRGRPRKEG